MALLITVMGIGRADYPQGRADFCGDFLAKFGPAPYFYPFSMYT
jgi:hypothetical protein